MNVITLSNIKITGISSCVPAKSEDNLARCTAVYGDEKKALSIVKATGIKSRRVLDAGVTTLDLSIKAAKAVLENTGTKVGDIGAVVYVTFTPDRQMPCNACMAQARLGLEKNIIAFDLNLACSGWLYGVYVAGLMAKSIGKKVLLLDGDTQTAHLDPNDAATVPLLSDAGTATIIQPTTDGSINSFIFGFMADGEKGEALQLPFGGTISMDGFAVFKFVTMDVLRFVQEFMNDIGRTPEQFDAFVPHQANIFMIEQIAKKLKFDSSKLKKSGDVLGNSSSATVPTTIAYTQARGILLATGFGGGLSVSVAQLQIDEDCHLSTIDY